MDNSEAQFILQAYRPGGQDAGDPAFGDALEQARRDPELARWFAEQQALDAAIAGRLQSFPVPGNLKADILAGRKVVRTGAFLQSRTVLALAASLAVLLSLAGFRHFQILGSRPQFAAFQADMGRFLNHIERLDFHTEDMSKARHWLETTGGHDELVLPPRLEGQPCVGCRVLDWQGRKVSLVCYYLKSPASDNGGSKPKIDELHLLVIDRKELRDPPVSLPPQFAVDGKWETASWADKHHAYILAGVAQGNYLRDYFVSGGDVPDQPQ